jgi:hypothetical protein
MSERKPWADADHPSNTLRPGVRCIGCGKLGCVTYWGKWCFACNVPRMTRLSAAFDSAAASLRRLGQVDE